MKNTLLSFSLTLALAVSAHGQYTVAVNSLAGGAFDNLVNTGTLNTQTNIPTDGASISNAFLPDTTFSTAFLNSTFGNIDTYKVGVKNASEGVAGAGAWADSSNAHAFALNVVGIPLSQGGKPGPRWRVNYTRDNGTTQNGTWSDLVTGNNQIGIAGVAWDRVVAIQLAGVINWDLFSHDYTSGTDSIAVVSAVPEPSSYALLAGLFACTYMMVRRRAVS